LDSHFLRGRARWQPKSHDGDAFRRSGGKFDEHIATRSPALHGRRDPVVNALLGYFGIDFVRRDGKLQSKTPEYRLAEARRLRWSPSATLDEKGTTRPQSYLADIYPHLLHYDTLARTVLGVEGSRNYPFVPQITGFRIELIAERDRRPTFFQSTKAGLKAFVLSKPQARRRTPTYCCSKPRRAAPVESRWQCNDSYQKACIATHQQPFPKRRWSPNPRARAGSHPDTTQQLYRERGSPPKRKRSRRRVHIHGRSHRDFVV